MKKRVRPGFQLCILMMGLLGSQLAWSDVAVVVSANSPIDEVSAAELTDAFLGQSRRVGSGLNLIPIDRAEDSDLRDRFYRSLTGNTPAQMRMHWSRLIFTGRGQPPQVVRADHDLKAYLSERARAVSYMHIDDVDDSLRVLMLLED